MPIKESSPLEAPKAIGNQLWKEGSRSYNDILYKIQLQTNITEIVKQ